MTYWEEPYARVTLEEDVPAVMIEWLRYATSVQFRKGLEKELEAYSKFAASYKKLHWIAETIKMIGVGADDIQWVVHELNPKMYAAGLRHMAVVVPQSVFSKMSVDDYVRNTNATEIEIKNFSSLADAKAWLKTKS